MLDRRQFIATSALALTVPKMRSRPKIFGPVAKLFILHRRWRGHAIALEWTRTCDTPWQVCTATLLYGPLMVSTPQKFNLLNPQEVDAARLIVDRVIRDEPDLPLEFVAVWNLLSRGECPAYPTPEWQAQRRDPRSPLVPEPFHA